VDFEGLCEQGVHKQPSSQCTMKTCDAYRLASGHHDSIGWGHELHHRATHALVRSALFTHEHRNQRYKVLQCLSDSALQPTQCHGVLVASSKLSELCRDLPELLEAAAHCARDACCAGIHDTGESAAAVARAACQAFEQAQTWHAREPRHEQAASYTCRSALSCCAVVADRAAGTAPSMPINHSRRL
jgi:hypothetical protein